MSLSMSSTTVISTSLNSAKRCNYLNEDVLNQSSPINTGWMEKVQYMSISMLIYIVAVVSITQKGKICQNWKRRYFELFDDGKLVYYTDETKRTRKGIADLSTIIGFHGVDNKTFEVITPQRIWCFRCKFKSECHFWIESMKAIEHSHLHHDGYNVNERDYLRFSSNDSVLKLIAKMGPPEGERILYSDRILMSHGDQGRRSVVLMLTTVAIYHLLPNQDNIFGKCDYRMPWRSDPCCVLLNPHQLCIGNVVYQTETVNLRAILRALSEANNEVLFQRVEDEAAFCADLMHDDHGDLVDLLPESSTASSSITSSRSSSFSYCEDSDSDSDSECTSSSDSTSIHSSGLCPLSLELDSISPDPIGLDPFDIESFELEHDYNGSPEGVELVESVDTDPENIWYDPNRFQKIQHEPKGKRKNARIRTRNALKAKDFYFLPVIPESVSKSHISDTWFRLSASC